jgi:hypothetical protein
MRLERLKRKIIKIALKKTLMYQHLKETKALKVSILTLQDFQNDAKRKRRKLYTRKH